MTINGLIIQAVAVLVAIACALPGVFLVLRRVAMISDAISHSILFGIVFGFVLTRDLDSPLLFAGAVASGMLTVWLVEVLIQSRRVNGDAAIGLVFPLLFSVAVLVINTGFRNVHLDVDAVLLGEIAFAPLNRIELFGLMIPRGLLTMGAVALLNLGLIIAFYKELKLTTFDPALAAALGFSPVLMHYGLMTLVSLTAVGSFDHVGSVLVIALMIAPPAAAYLLTDRLDHMLWISAGIGSVSAVAGYWAARALQLNIAGMMAAMAGLCFLLALAFAPRQGLLARALEASQRRRRFAVDMLVVHLLRHEGTPREAEECTVDHLTGELSWESRFAQEALQRAGRDDLILMNGERLSLTEQGRLRAASVLGR